MYCGSMRRLLRSIQGLQLENNDVLLAIQNDQLTDYGIGCWNSVFQIDSTHFTVMRVPKKKTNTITSLVRSHIS